MAASDMRYYNPYDDVHEDMHPFLDSWAAVVDRPLHTMTAAEVRAKLDNLGADKRPPRPEGLEVEDIVAELDGRNLAMRIYRPAGLKGPQPAMLYFHGGGWTIGNLETHDRYVAYYAKESGIPFIAVDYRRSPENKHPAQLFDAFDSLVWLKANAERLGFDPDRIGMGGDSAGAQMTAGTTLLGKEKGGPKIVFQLLIYPVVDSNYDRYSWWRYRDGPILTRDWQIWCWRNWQTDPVPQPDVYAYPLQAEDLSGLPPAHLAISEIDVLYDEGVLYAHRLLDAGVATGLQVCRRLPHGFMRAMYVSDYVRNEMRQIADAVRRGFAAYAPAK